MGMDSKQDFLRILEQDLSETVTVSDMNRIMRTISDTMEEFDIQRIANLTEEQDDCLECYLSALSVECKSQKTIDRYAYIIGKMMRYVKVPTRRISVYHLRTYLAAEKARGLADTTLKGIRDIFSAYFNWLHKEGLIDRNPAANLGKIKCAIKEKKTYSEVDIELLNENAVKNRFGTRDRAIISFLLSTGCRIGEVVELDRNNVDLKKLECVVHGKGDKERIVYMNELTGMLLGNYLDSRKDEDPALFVNRFGRRMKAGGYRKMLRTVGAMAGVEKVHPHKFRRTFATTKKHRGMPIEDIKELMGHNHIETTMGYIQISRDDVRESYRRFA